MFSVEPTDREQIDAADSLIQSTKSSFSSLGLDFSSTSMMIFSELHVNMNLSASSLILVSSFLPFSTFCVLISPSCDHICLQLFTLSSICPCSHPSLAALPLIQASPFLSFSFPPCKTPSSPQSPDLQSQGAERREMRSTDQFRKLANLFSPKSLTITEVLQRRMMGNYAGLEICSANLASPSLLISYSFCLFPSDFSLSSSLSVSSSCFLSVSQELQDVMCVVILSI